MSPSPRDLPRRAVRSARRRVAARLEGTPLGDRIARARGLAPEQRPEPPARPRGRPPRTELRTTHLGPMLDAAVLNAEQQMRVGADADYDLVQQHFDARHYLLQAPRLLERPRLDLVRNFLRAPLSENRSPDPHFSLAHYLEHQPQHRQGRERHPYLEWLKRGRAAGELADPSPAIPEMARILGMEQSEVVGRLVARRQDLIDRLLTGELGEMYERAGRLEPLVARADVRFTRPRMLPFGDPTALKQVALIHAAQEAAGFRRARLVIVVNRPRWGGGRRMEGHLAHALADRMPAEEIVVVYSDHGGSAPPGRFPEGVRELDFASLVGELEPEAAQHALVVLLRTFHADAIVNINSPMLYGAMRTLGKALTASERLFLCFFCSEQIPTGAWTGWTMRYFYRLFEQVEGVIADSHDLAEDLISFHHIPPSQRDRLHVFSAPVDPGLPAVSSAPEQTPGRRPQVFWAGRWDRQKRIELFLGIARAMPDVDFRMWGESVMDQQAHDLPSNVLPQGRYGHISEVPLAEADAWLYTSGWDGVPSQLLEVGVTGVPVVGTLVGGTGEVLDPDLSWPVPEDAGPEEYVAALRAVLTDPAGARSRALELRERLLAERTRERFAEQAAAVLLQPEEERDQWEEGAPA